MKPLFSRFRPQHIETLALLAAPLLSLMAHSQSASETRLFFVSGRSGEPEIYSASANGSNPVDISNNAAQSDYEPALSTYGSRIAFRRGGNIWTMKPDGSEQINSQQTEWTPPR